MVKENAPIIVREGIIISAGRAPVGTVFRGEKDTVWHPQFTIFQPSEKHPLEVHLNDIRPVGDERLHVPIADDANKPGNYKVATLYLIPADKPDNHEKWGTMYTFKNAFVPDPKDPNQKKSDVNLDMLKIGESYFSYIQDSIWFHALPGQYDGVLFGVMSNQLYRGVGYKTHHSGTQGLPSTLEGQIKFDVDDLRTALLKKILPKLNEHFQIEDTFGNIKKD